MTNTKLTVRDQNLNSACDSRLKRTRCRHVFECAFCSRFQCCLALALCLHLTGLQARIQEGLLKAKLSDSEQLIAYMKSS